MKLKSTKNAMVIARVMGGLGNQLFIYAAAKRLAVVNQVPLLLDISGYSEDTFERSYSLHHFQINEKFASSKDVYDLNLGKRRNFHYHLNKILPLRYKCFVREGKLFEPRLLDLKVVRKIYLDGYWQNENYFKDIEPQIRKHFKIATPHKDAIVELAGKISAVNSVCIHARRHNYEYLLSPEYYHHAIKQITDQLSHPHFFCFSDDPAWVKNYIKTDWPLTHVPNDENSKDYEHLWLMTQCKHYIIANSSYSWWGAWLNANPDKIVIAPKDWGYRTVAPKEWLSL